MVHVADEKLAGGCLGLCMTAEAQIVVGLREHGAVDGAMRLVADRAAFAQGGMFKHKRTRLFTMALRTIAIPPRHGQTARALEDIAAVRVMAFRTMKPPLNDEVMDGRFKFGADREMATETGFRFAAGVDDEVRPAAGLDVFAAGAVAGFASRAAGEIAAFRHQPRMRVGGKLVHEVRMALGANRIADEMRARDFQRRRHRARLQGGTRNQEQRRANGHSNQSRLGDLPVEDDQGLGCRPTR